MSHENGMRTESVREYGTRTVETRGHTLRIAESELANIRREAQAAYPDECCGILVGTRKELETSVVRLHQTVNAREASARTNRFLITPRDVMRAQRDAAERGLEIVGYYHSHPDCPAKPSDTDRDSAWPDVSYLIVSVNDGQVTNERSWRLLDDRSGYSEEILIPRSRD